jgi:branched-chain amino acid transport system substrate-binding protein
MRRQSGFVVLAALAGTALAACVDDSPNAQTTSTIGLTAPQTTVGVVDDGVLRIGVLLPQTGAGASFGEPLFQAVEFAVDEINQAGGVNGRPVELAVADEGDDITTASKGAGELVDANVDVVIGPASSRNALNVLETFVNLGIATCSPTATAIRLTNFPDNQSFIRTIPSDALQAVAISDLIEDAGVSSAAILAPADDFGRPYADAVAQALRRRGITVTASVLVDNDMTASDAVADALATGPAAIAVVGNGVIGPQLLSALDEKAPEHTRVVVNDAVRRMGVIDASTPLPRRINVSGTSPQASASSDAPWFTEAFATYRGVDPATASSAFAANAYDCVSLVTLAAQAAKMNTAAGVVATVGEVSQSGSVCRNFITCSLFLEQNLNIDLNGASGPIDLDGNGDVAIGLFEQFRFDETGRDITVGDLEVTAS